MGLSALPGGRWQTRGRLLALLLGLWLIAACEPPAAQDAPLDSTHYRLTRGEALDEIAAIHPEEPRALLVRHRAPEGASVHNPEQALTRHIIDLDFHDPARPKETEITALSGASHPSYAPGAGIVALDRTGLLVFLPRGSTEARPIDVTGTPSRPSKPVASPDGQWVGFLAIPTPPPSARSGDRLVLDDPSHFRYQAWVAPREGGPARRIGSGAADEKTLLTELRWNGPGSLLLVYQVVDPRLTLTRVEEVDIEGGDRRLAFYGDLPSHMSFPRGYRFLVRPDADKGLIFASRALETEIPLRLAGQPRSWLLSPDGRYCLVALATDEKEGVNLWRVPTPPEMLALPTLFREP